MPQRPFWYRWQDWMLDVSPLKDSQAFCILFCVRSVSTILYGVLNVALSWQVFQHAHSTFHVAALGVFTGVGLILGLIVGGSLADLCDRRKLMIAGRTVYTLVALILLGNTLLSQMLWLMYLAVFISGIASGISAPALLSVAPSVIKPEQFRAAGALNAISLQVGALLGPLLAGFLIAWQGVLACYIVVVAGAACLPVMLHYLPALPPSEQPAAHTWWQIPQGWQQAWRFVRDDKTICRLFALDITLSFFVMPLVLLPHIGTQVLHGDARVVSMLYAAPAFGALIAALFSGWTRQQLLPWPLMTGAAMLMMVVLAGLGLTAHLWQVLACLGLYGFAKTIGDIVRMAMLQERIPSVVRGRVSSLWLIQGNLSPALGGLQIGWLTERIWFGGALLVSAACAGISTSIISYRAQKDIQTTGQHDT